MNYSRHLYLLLLCLMGMQAFAQHAVVYDKDLLPSDFYLSRREALRKLLPDSSAVVLLTAPVRNRANDVDYDYHPSPDFYYLTGYTEPDAVLLMFKEEQRIGYYKAKDFLFVRDRDARAEMWTGRRLGVQGTKEQTGMTSVFSSAWFDSLCVDFSKYKQVFTIFPGGISGNDAGETADLYALEKIIRKKSRYIHPAIDSTGLTEMLARLREVKEVGELILMRKAIDITCNAHLELMKALEPGMYEYQAQAMLEYLFKQQGAEASAYPTIAGGGENSCVLHYTSNRKQLSGNHLIVVDAGAEYHGYAADITRTLPVDGIFSTEEKAIYQLVSEAQDSAFRACLAGNPFRSPHLAAYSVISKGLVKLGIITQAADAKKYFMHGTSHYLGLDVHDAGSYGTLKEGAVITVEPGIYIPEGSDCDKKWWNIGVRIEDDVLITDASCEILSEKLPKSISAIEILMKQKSFFNQKQGTK